MNHHRLSLRSSVLGAFLGLCTASAPGFAQEASRPVMTISSGIADITTLDPHRAALAGDINIVPELYSALVRFTPGSADPKDIEPDLAEKWETSPDNKVWTFHLRKGVQFHHGYGELKASDVVYSLQRSSDTQRSSFAANFSGIEKIEAIDDYTVNITLKYPDANFLGLLSNYHGGFIISKSAAEKLGAKFGQNPVGTGPFEFDEHITQQYVKLTANDAYFRGSPKIGGLVYRMIPSDSARDLAFASGEIDLAAGKREQRWVERAKARGTLVDVFDPLEYRTLFLNRSIKPLDNLKVRQAIAAAVNVDDIVRYVGKSITNKGCSVVPSGYVGEDCTTGPYTFDVARAKQLLSEAGYPNGLTLKSVVSNVAVQQPIMEIVQSQLSNVGIKLDMEVVDHATYQAKSRQNQSAIVFYGAARFPNADYWLTEFYDSSSSIGTPTAMLNFSHCSVADKAIRDARIEPDANRQLELWKQAQAQIHDDVCAVPLFGLKQVWVHSKRVNFGYELKGAINTQPLVTELTTLSESAN